MRYKLINSKLNFVGEFNASRPSVASIKIYKFIVRKMKNKQNIPTLQFIRDNNIEEMKIKLFCIDNEKFYSYIVKASEKEPKQYTLRRKEVDISGKIKFMNIEFYNNIKYQVIRI